MPLFQVLSRTIQPSVPPKLRNTRINRRRSTALRIFCALLVIGVLVILASKSGEYLYFFILLPVSFSIIMTHSRRYYLNMLLSGTLVYGLLTICLPLIYYGGITGLELVTHPPNVARIIIICTTLTWTVLLGPLRTRAQAFINRHFNLRDHEATKAVEAFTSTLREEIDLDQLREHFFEVVQKIMQPQSISVWVRMPAHYKLGHPSTLLKMQDLAVERFPSTVTFDITVTNTDPIVGYALRHPGSVEIERLQLDSPILQTLKSYSVEIVLPLATQGELIGLLTLGPHLSGQEYTLEDLTLLNTLATQVAPALRVTQLVQEQQMQIRERERIEQELRTAQFIQHSLLPKEVPMLPGWLITAYYQSAKEVGGDFYDFLPFEDGRIGIVIGDVTDKGVPAALVMATTHTMLRTIAQRVISPGEVLAKVNDLLYIETPASMFVTCFYAILDPGSGRLLYANAGQDLPYQQHNGCSSELWAVGMPLGMMPSSHYEEQEVILAPGDSVLFYSDGLVEAHNSKREMFSFPRLQTLLTEYSSDGTLINFLLDELKNFTGPGWEQEDDVTLVMLQRASKLNPFVRAQKR